MVPVDLRLKFISTHQPTLPSGEETSLLNCVRSRSKKEKIDLLVLPSTVQPPSAALPQAFAVPPLWTSVQLMAQLRPTVNPTSSAQFTSQVPMTARFTPPLETRAPPNAPFIQRRRPQTVPSTQQRLKTAPTVPSTTQGRRRTALCTRRGLTTPTATKTAPCMVKVVRRSLPRTVHFTPQGSRLASVPQNRTRMKRWKQGTINLASRRGETRAA